MSAYEVYVYDDRYSVPTLHFIAADDAASVAETARSILLESPHHRRVEVWRSDERVFAAAQAGEAQPRGQTA